MKRIIYIIPFLFFISCQSSISTMEEGESENSLISQVEKGKPVIALFPVIMDQQEPAAQTLGEAFSGELTGLLGSMQTYDVRDLPPEYGLEDLKERLYDNAIQAEVRMDADGGLNLQTSVFDARTGEELVSINETTYDYLSLFSLAEEMVSFMVEEFYGEHIALAELKITRNVTVDEKEELALFVDGAFREPDENGIVQILAGTHEILIMGHSGDWQYYRDSITLEEGTEQSLILGANRVSQLLYKGQPLDFDVDGKPDDWIYVEKAVEDEENESIDDPGMDFLWLKLASDSNKLYGIAELAGPFKPGRGQFVLQFVPFGLPHSSFTINMNPDDDPPLNLWIYSRGESVDERGKVVPKGNFLEFSLDWEDIALYEDTPNTLKVSLHYGNEWTEIHSDSVWRTEKVELTGDPTPMLAWENKGWMPGTNGRGAQYRVPFNLIAPDRDPSDWVHIPTTASDNSDQSVGSLRLLKSARDEEHLYLFLQSRGKWDSKSSLIFELDCGDGQKRELYLFKRKAELLIDGETHSIDGEIQWGVNFLEIQIPLDELGETLDYCNVMKVIQEEGNEIPVIPYY